MKTVFLSHRYYFLLVFIFLLAELIVRPFGDYPINDDWSYAKSVVILQNEQRLDIGDWPAMTLVTHLLWGLLFVKVFGFSFLTLRLSTIVSMLIGMWVLNKLVIRITENKLAGFIACLTLLFNPIYFSCTNTFMTDVNFLTLTIIAIYLAFDFFSAGTNSSFYLVFLISLLMVMLRQYGIIAPIAFTCACFFISDKRWFFVSIAVALTMLIYLVLQQYENHLKTVLPPWAAYKFSGAIPLTQYAFWQTFIGTFAGRYRIIILHVAVYTFPFVVAYTPSILKANSVRLCMTLVAGIGLVVYFLYKDQNFQVGNVFNETAVGPDTTFETLKGTYGEFPHFYSKTFDTILSVLKYIIITWAFTILILFSIKSVRSGGFKLRPMAVFLSSFFLPYCFAIIITETFFDRYQLPYILLALVAFVFMNKTVDLKPQWSFFTLLAFGYVSVLGSRDYFTMNDHKWEAYRYLKEEKNIPKEEINGGFEVNCWNEGQSSMWYDFMDLSKYNYLIQYRQEEGFVKMKEYSYQRWLPYKIDTLRVYEREEKMPKKSE